jgi:hypothetical protein
MRQACLAALIIAASLLPVFVQGAIVAHVGFAQGDFRAFYCAARVASHGADPYQAAPLQACEASAGQRLFYGKMHPVTVPAPLPGYVIAAVLPFALLPFGVASVLWVLLLFFAWATCIATIVRFAGITWQTTLAVTSLSLGVSSIPFGEVLPLSLASICAAGYFAHQRRWRAAGVAGTLAMLEPHIGLPVCIALAVWAPATRFTLAAGFAVLAAISLLALGPHANVEYFLRVLPAHALSEAARDTQYSLTSVLVSFGSGDVAAIRAGFIWYAAMVAIGTIAAGMLAKQTRNRAFLACAPPAFAVLGGTFIHITQLAAALPATLLLIRYLQGRVRTIAVVALLLLSVPWSMSSSPSVALASVFPIAYLAWVYSRGNVRATTLAGVAAGMLIISINAAYVMQYSAHALVSMNAAIDPKLAESSWSSFSSESSSHDLASWIARPPTWIGLILILAIAMPRASARRGTQAP